MKQQQTKYLDIQRYLLNYFAKVRFVFTKGNLRFSLQQNKVNIVYFQQNNSDVYISLSFPLKKLTKKQISELVYNIQDFIINCYCEYEREGEQVKLKILSALIGISISSTDGSIQRILHKAKKNLYQKT